jgi:hypothetical protein
MKTIGETVRNYVEVSVGCSIYKKSVWNPVGMSVWEYVYDFTGDSVRESVRDSVENLVFQFTKEKLK